MDERLPIALAEGGIFAAEFGLSIAYARYLASLERSYEPDWTWATVMGGVILSSLPAQALARLIPGTWRDYERRAIIGFCVSGAVIIPWQLWQAATREGEERARLLALGEDNAYPQTPLERRSARPARRLLRFGRTLFGPYATYRSTRR